MLKTIQLPARISDLNSRLTDVNADDFPHCSLKDSKFQNLNHQMMNFQIESAFSAAFYPSIGKKRREID
jgi:hypothetical protein